jgi:hypothetical protein
MERIELLPFLLTFIPSTAPHSSPPIIRCWYNRPNSGRRTNRTQSNRTPRNRIKNRWSDILVCFNWITSEHNSRRLPLHQSAQWYPSRAVPERRRSEVLVKKQAWTPKKPIYFPLTTMMSDIWILSMTVNTQLWCMIYGFCPWLCTTPKYDAWYMDYVHDCARTPKYDAWYMDYVHPVHAHVWWDWLNVYRRNRISWLIMLTRVKRDAKNSASGAINNWAIKGRAKRTIKSVAAYKSEMRSR